MSNLPIFDIKNAFEPTVTKKQCKEIAKQIAAKTIEDGEMTPAEALGQLTRMEVIVSEAKAAIKPHIEADAYGAGISFTLQSGRKMAQWADDPVYAEMQKKLKERESLLKAALNSSESIYDSEGIEVPKVSLKFAADSIVARF